MTVKAPLTLLCCGLGRSGAVQRGAEGHPGFPSVLPLPRGRKCVKRGDPALLSVSVCLFVCLFWNVTKVMTFVNKIEKLFSKFVMWPVEGSVRHKLVPVCKPRLGLLTVISEAEGSFNRAKNRSFIISDCASSSAPKP